MVADMNVGINVNANVSALSQAADAMRKVERALARAANVAAEAAEALAFVAGGAEAIGDSSGKSIKSLISMEKALQKVAASSKGVDFEKFGKDLDLTFITKRLNDLQKRVGEKITPEIDISGVQDAFNEISRLTERIQNEVRQGLEQLEIPERLTNVGGLDFDLRQSFGRGVGGEANLVLQFEETRAEANRLVDSTEELRRKMRQLGPDAESGVGEAVDQFREMAAQLQINENRAVELRDTLKRTATQFENLVRAQNIGLGSAGIEPITLEDIFPSAEQRKLADLQNRINAATRDSIREASFRRTLNFFTPLNVQAGQLDQNVVNLTSHLPRLRYALYDVSNTAAILGAALIGASAGVVKVGADFERVFADVERTVGDGSDESIQALNQIRRELIDLSATIPVSFEDLAGIATLAGQLNIAADDVARFTETVAQFTATTDVSLDAAATAFGRLDQLVEGVDGQFDRLASSILSVGVNAVATESDIISIASQISSVANIAGFTADELVGFSSALASVGTRPELARGTTTRLFTEISQAVAGTKDTLDDFARVAGQSSEQFASAWTAGRGAEQVVAILRGLQEEGKNAELVLRDLGITSVRDVPTLLKLAQGVEEVERQLAIARIGFIENNELQRQYGILSTTLTERLVKLRNSFEALIATFGNSTGVVSLLVEGLTQIANGLRFIVDTPVGRAVGTASVAFAALAGVVVLAAGAAARGIASFVGLFTAVDEGLETIYSIQVNVEALSGSMAKLSTSTDGATGSMAGFNNEVNKTNATSQQSTDGVVVFGDALEKTDKNSRKSKAGLNGLAGSMAKLGTNFKSLAKVATTFLKFSIAGLIGSTVISVFLKLAEDAGQFEEKLSDAEQKAKDLRELIGDDTSSFLSAVRQDTEDFINDMDTASSSVEFFYSSVDSGESSLSDFGRAMAIASGEQELLALVTDDATDALERQRLVLGENTEALIRQRLATDLAAAVTESNLTPKLIGQAASRSLEGQDLGQYFSADARVSLGLINEEEAGLVSVFEILGDPQLGARLAENGFVYKEFIDAAVSGNTELANSILQNLAPAAEQLRDSLVAQDAERFADQISYLNGVIAFGASGLSEYVGLADRLREATKQLTLEQIAAGQGFEVSAQSVEDYRAALIGLVDETYAQINAERTLEGALATLGEAFATQSADVVANGQEMQAAIKALIGTASNSDEAIDGLTRFYNTIVNDGYLAQEQLLELQNIIIETYRTTAQVQLETLRGQRAALGINAIYTDINEQIQQVEDSLGNINAITQRTSTSAQYSENLANGYSRAADNAERTAGAAGRTADNTRDAADEIERVTPKVRTLLDYASDLDRVISRAFDIRYASTLQLDNIASAWQSLSERVQDARDAIEDLQASQDELASDRAIKEYFLSVAESYGDMLRAAQLREELAEMDRERERTARDLRQQQLIAGGDLTGTEEGSRENRAALLDLVQEYQDYIVVLAESGASQDELRAATQQAREEFIRQATELGFQREIVLEYAKAFDDVTTAINNVPRDITVSANVDPALQALAELRASLNETISRANALNDALDQRGGRRVSDESNFQRVTPTTASNAGLNIISVGGRQTVEIGTVRQPSPSRTAVLPPGLAFSSGGYTGAGGKYEPAGVVHRGEYVVPKSYVNQSTGLPSAGFLAQMQQMQGYAMGGFVGGGGGGGFSDNAVMVELSPYDRKLLQDAGNVQLRLNGRVVAEATNDNNFNQARRGSS